LPHEDEVAKDLKRATELAEAHALRVQYDVKVAELVTTYLKPLWDHSLQQIASKHGITAEQALRAETHVVMGVPANWKSGTRGLLLDAARAAGIPGRHPLSTVETYMEAEAAAIALLECGSLRADSTVRYNPHHPSSGSLETDI
jgi:hypothetical protein